MKLAARLTPFLPAGKRLWLSGSILPGRGTALGLHQHKSDASHPTSTPELVHPTLHLEKETAMAVLAVLRNSVPFSSPSAILQTATFCLNPRNFASQWAAQSKWSNSGRHSPNHSLELGPNASYSAPWERLFKALERNCHNVQSWWDTLFFSGLGTWSISALSSILQ